MGRHTVKAIWARKRRLVGASFAVVLGVAFLTATLVLGDGMRGGVDALFVEGYSGTDARVRSSSEIGSLDTGSRGTIDEALAGELAALPTVGLALPAVEGLAQLVGADGDPVGGNGPPTFGVNWVDYDRNPYVLRAGRPPAGPGEVVIDRGAADVAGLTVGDVATVLVPHPVEVTVTGIAELRSGATLGGVTFTWFDTATAQELLLGRSGQLSFVDLTAAPGVSPDQLVDAVGDVLPGGLEVVTGDTLVAEDNADLAAEFLDFLEVFLLVFAGIALLVATFSIHNTLSILVAQRTRESALLRAIGASRRQVLASVTVEALLLGAVAAAVGLGAGVGLAMGLDALMDAAGFGVPTAGLGADGATIVTALAVGVGVTLVASIAPAVKASRVAPLAALRDVDVDRSGTSVVRAAVGGVVLAAGVAGVVTAPESPDRALAMVGLGALLALAGMVLVGPVVARLAAGTIGAPVAALGGHSGRLARRNAMRNPRRTAGTASALMIGTAVVALFATFGASIKETLAGLVDDGFTGDLVVVQEGFSGAGLSPDLAAAVDALPEVEQATGLAFANVLLDGEAEEPFALDPAAMATMVDLDVVAGSLAGMGPDGIAVGRDHAQDRGWSLGDEVEIGFADGATATVTVRALYANDNLMGDLLIDARAWEPHVGRVDDFMVMIRLADGVGMDAGRAAVDAVGGRLGAPAAQDREEYVESATGELDQMLNLVYGLLGLAIVIALLGIANTLSLSLHERTRELGLLRAVGQTRRQLRRTVRWESVILALFGTLGGLGLGTFLGWGMMRALEASEQMGTFVAPVGTLAVVVVAAVVAGVVAAARPARRAARQDVLAAIATD